MPVLFGEPDGENKGPYGWGDAAATYAGGGAAGVLGGLALSRAAPRPATKRPASYGFVGPSPLEYGGRQATHVEVAALAKKMGLDPASINLSRSPAESAHSRIEQSGSAIRKKLQVTGDAPYGVNLPPGGYGSVRRLIPSGSASRKDLQVTGDASHGGNPLLDGSGGVRRFVPSGPVPPPSPDRVSRGVAAHELGHVAVYDRLKNLGGKPLLRANDWGRRAGLGLTGLGTLGAAFAPDDRTAFYSALAGTAGMAPTVANELAASHIGGRALAAYHGGPLLRRLGNYSSAYRGVPTYLMSSATPFATYGARKLYKHLRGLKDHGDAPGSVKK